MVEEDLKIDEEAAKYDKLGKLRWLLHKIRNHCKVQQHFNYEVIVNELVVR